MVDSFFSVRMWSGFLVQSVSSVLCWPSFYPGRELGTTPYGFDKCIQFPLFTKSLISSIEVDDGTSTLRSKETSRMAARSNEARTKEKEGKKANLK